MKQLSVFVLFMLFAGRAIPAIAQVDFGSPPAGQIPIIFNDHHVYSRPTALRKSRVLAALVKDGEILIPLRSMLEEMGAKVSLEEQQQTVVVKSISSVVRLTIGSHQITIDGVTRPLDVPAMRKDGDILVPIRVITEAFGAYVSWLPQYRAVAIHYVPVTSPAYLPPAVPAPTASPGAETAPPPVAPPRIPPGPPVPVGTPPSEVFIEINDVDEPRVNNAFSPGDHGSADQSFSISGAAEANVFGTEFVLDGEADRSVYPTHAGFVKGIDGSEADLPLFVAKDFNYDVHLGVQLTPQKYYVAIGYASESTNYGYPRVGGFGLGLEKLPELHHRFSFDASAFYYPNVSGSTASFPLSYSLVQYRAGLTYSLPEYLFVDAGIEGDATHAKSAPVGTSQFAPALGLGLYF